MEQNSEFRGKHRYVYSIYDKETKNKYTLGKVLGKLNSHMQNNETRLLSIHKSWFKMDQRLDCRAKTT